MHWALPWVCVSLLLNLALVWKISHPHAGSLPVSPAASLAIAAVNRPAVKTTNNTVANTETTLSNADAPFSWNQLESTDYRKYVANLRAAGFPELMIRDLVRADLAAAFAERTRTIFSLTPAVYWQNDRYQQPDAKQRKQLLALNREQQDTLADLFGTHFTAQESIDLVMLQLHGQQQELLFLSADQRDAAQQALAEAGFDADSASERHSLNQKDETAQFEEKMKALAKVLSPTELEEYRLRNSPWANLLRGNVRYFDCTPEEFKSLLEAREKIGDKWMDQVNLSATARQKIQDALGEERAQEFERVSDMFYVNTRLGAEQNGVPIERTEQAWGVIRDARATADRIAKDNSVSVADRRAQLEALSAQIAAQLKDKLGGPASRGVIRDLKVTFSTQNLKP